MAEHNETGKKGENFALQILHHKGYKILETNWRYRRCEVDIIAFSDNVMVFIEVKTRSNLYFGEPAAFVSQRKEALIMEAAAAYMTQTGWENAYRFDIISVELHSNDKCIINHYEDAFGGE